MSPSTPTCIHDPGAAHRSIHTLLFWRNSHFLLSWTSLKVALDLYPNSLVAPFPVYRDLPPPPQLPQCNVPLHHFLIILHTPSSILWADLSSSPVHLPVDVPVEGSLDHHVAQDHGRKQAQVCNTMDKRGALEQPKLLVDDPGGVVGEEDEANGEGSMGQVGLYNCSLYLTSN